MAIAFSRLLVKPSIQRLFQLPPGREFFTNGSHCGLDRYGAQSCLEARAKVVEAEGIPGTEATSLQPKEGTLVRNGSRPGEIGAQQQIDEKEHGVVPCFHLLKTAASGLGCAKAAPGCHPNPPHDLLGVVDSHIIPMEKGHHLRSRKKTVPIGPMPLHGLLHAIENDVFSLLLHPLSLGL